MFDYAKARRAMLDCQIHTHGVVDPAVLDAFATVPRERFAPAALQSVAYTDEDLPQDFEGRWLIEPAVHARMVQALALKAGDVVLCVGGGSGYASAVLSLLATTVIAVDEAPCIERAGALWQEFEYCNIVGCARPLTAGYPDSAPYNAIFINGAVSEVPAALVSQLMVGGQMVAVIKPPGRVMGEACLIRHGGNGQYSKVRLFDAGTPYLPEFVPEPVFQF